MPVEFKTPEDLLNAYNNGLKGSFFEPAHYEQFMASLKYPYFGAAAPWLKDSGKGKLSTPYKSVLKFFANAFGDDRQTTSDCFISSTLIRMADGTLKQISDIKIGDMVLSHTNTPRKVTNFFKKPYTGKIIKLYVEGLREPLELTPDHQLKFFPDITNHLNRKTKFHKWTDKLEFIRSESIEIGDRVLVNYGFSENGPNKIIDLALLLDKDAKVSIDKIQTQNRSKEINRFIEIDSDLSWLIGIYLAEGSNNESNITFSLNINEKEYANQILRIIKDKFGIDGILNFNKEKQNVLLVIINSVIISKLFQYLCPGNVYTKSVHKDILSSNYECRMSCLRGWMDGDGYFNNKKRTNAEHYYFNLIGVSASNNLIDTMFSLALSCKLRPSIFTRKKEKHQTVASKSLHLYGKDVIAVYPEAINECKVKYNKKYSDITKYGLASKVKKIEEYNLIDDYVYCIEVDVEHTLQANFIAGKNCVTHGGRNAGDITRAVEIDIKGDLESWVARGATEVTYGLRGHCGAGMSCSRMAEILTKVGFPVRKKYGKYDLSVYDGRKGNAWCPNNVPQDLLDQIKDFKFQTATLIRSVEEARDALANGYGIAICSGQGFSSNRDEKGFCRPSGSWSHCLTLIGCDDRNLAMDFILANSWGKWCDGGHPDFGQLPTGCWLAHADTIARMIRGGGTFAFSNFDGFPVQNLPDYGSSGLYA